MSTVATDSLPSSPLPQAGIQVVKLMGYMPLAERRSVLAAFKSNPEIKVILMSLKAGGEGLNLQEASHVFLIEPWWNPAVEMQVSRRRGWGCLGAGGWGDRSFSGSALVF